LDARLVTPAGLGKLNAELQSLRSKREALVEGIRAGLEGMVDRGTSGEYLDARGELAQLEQQIAILEGRLVSAKVVQADPTDGVLGIGESVRVRDLDSGKSIEYRIVGTGEADPGAGSISYMSPVGSALLGRQAGDVIDVEAPKGVLRLEVLEIGL
jgi:transcription elongation factor GreA